MRWFGPPWPSGVCWDGEGRLRADNQVPTPTGQMCCYCETPVLDGESGVIMPMMTVAADGEPVAGMAPEHKECLVRSAVGSLAHVRGQCTCQGGTGGTGPVGDVRADAIAVWNEVGAGLR